MGRGWMRGALSACVLVTCAVLLSGCWPWGPAVTFEVRVVPATIDDLAQDASCLFLVTVEDVVSDPSALPVTLAATVSAGAVTIEPSSLAADGVAELLVNSEGVDVGSTVTVSVRAQRGTESRTAGATAVVTQPIEQPDDRLTTGTDMRDGFIPWLAAEHPELGIDAATVWTPIPLRPHILEVSFYMFLSEEWELVVWWHVMIPPYDWARLYLRHRDTEIAPSFGAEISSVSLGSEPQTMTPPEDVWR